MWYVKFILLLTVGILYLPTWTLGTELDSKYSTQSPYVLRTAVISSAGAPTGGSGYRQQGTLGQSTPTGISSGSGITFGAGFWRMWAGGVRVGVVIKPRIFTNQMFQNFPNPFNPTTTIEYSVMKAGAVEITIFNVKGQRVKRLIRETKSPGAYKVVWDGTNEVGDRVASGVYFYCLQAEGYRAVKKMVVLK